MPAEAKAAGTGAAASHARLDQFEEAWQANAFPSLDSVLDGVDGAARRDLLIELIKIDLDQRWRCSSVPPSGSPLPARPLLEDYARHFPELGDAPSLPIPLIREEYWVRHCWGDRPSVASYLTRFAAQSVAVKAALARVEAELTLEPGHAKAAGSTLAPGARIGGYLLIEALGAGVTGQVFKAKHEKTGNFVALKVIRPELLTSPDARRRFVQEIRATSQLSHPNVTRAFDLGDSHAMDFLAMEYFEGIDLDHLVKRSGPLPPDEAREYVRQAALGLQHIHQHGLVHRDIKPANLLLAKVPDGDGVIKILDLGLARLCEDNPSYSTLTREGTVMGTPDYMAPEQAADARTADIRADIYSLGCTLYYLLTGQPLFPGGTFIQKVDRHRWETPRAVEELRPAVPPALRAVLSKMLAKSPAERFGTPAELAAALEPGTEIIDGIGARSVDGGATHILIDGAQPSPGASLRVPGVGRGNTHRRLLLAIGACIALALTVLLLGPAREREPSLPPPRPRPVAPATPFDARIAQGVPEAQQSAGQPPEVVAVLGDQRWRQWGLVWSVGFSRDGRHIASAGEERSIRIWNPDTGREVMAIAAPHHVYAMAYSPDGRFLASGGLGTAVTLWDAATGHERQSLRRRPMVVRSLAISPDSQTVAAGADDHVIFWDAESGKEIGTWPLKGYIYALAFSHDGKTLAAGGPDGCVRLWDVELKREEPSLVCAPGAVRALAFAPDRRLLAAGGADGTVRTWNLERSQPEATILGRHGSPVRTLQFSPSGKTLASGTDGEDRAILVWDMERGRLQGAMRPRHERAHEGVFSVSFAPDGKTLASGSPDGTIRVWDVATRLERSAVPPSWSVDALEVAADGRMLAVGSRQGPGRLWDVESGAEAILEVAGGSPSAALAPRGERGMFGGQVGITFFDTQEKRPTQTQPAPGLPLLTAAYSPDGATLAIGSGDPHDRKKPGEIKLWDLAAGRAIRLTPGHDGSVESVAFGSPRSDGGPVLTLATGGGDGVVILWDMARRTENRRLTKHTGRVRVVAFAPDGRLATGSDDGTLRLWDAARGTEFATALRARRGGFLCAAWSPDGQRLAACDESNAVTVWDVGAWRRLFLRDMPGPVHRVRFTPDGRYLLTGNANGTVYVLDLDGANRPSP